MLVFIPMAGFGDRYLRAGYNLPKPLIPVDGKPMIERVVDAFRDRETGAFPEGVRFLYTVNETHARDNDVRGTIERITPGAAVAVIAPHKDGPVRTLLDCASQIPDDDDVLLNYCDFGVAWSFAQFRAWLKEKKWNGAMTAYRGFHPHSLGPTLYAYMKNDGDRVTEIREKHHFTADKLKEYASSGLYWFDSGKRMKQVAQALFDKGERVNGEFYISMMMQALLEDRGTVGVYELDKFYQWGTPEDLRDFEAWMGAHRRFPGFLEEVGEVSSKAAQVIPMAGRGQRFADQGYADPKPLVPVNAGDPPKAAPMIARALACLPKAKERVLVVQKDHLANERFRKVVDDLGGRLLAVEKVTQGQACTARLGLEGIDPKTPVLFAPCDCGYLYDPKKLVAMEESGEWDAIVWTARGHLPALWRPKMYGWITQADGAVTAAKVKALVEGVGAADQEIMTGTFWFKDAATFLAEEDAMEKDDDRINGEFYIDTIIKRMVERGARVAAFSVDKVLSWGTPEELKTFEYYGEVTRTTEYRR